MRRRDSRAEYVQGRRDVAAERLRRCEVRTLDTPELLDVLGIEPDACSRQDTVLDGRVGRQLAAAVELGRRMMRDAERGRALSGPAAVAAYLRPRVAMETVEVFYLLGVDIKNRVIIEREVGRGTVTGVTVHPRDVFRPAIAANCAAVLVGHNHPSGDPTPSLDDFELTRRLVDAGQLLGIPVLDHVVVTGEDFRSALS